jgi:hypothetical protein
MSHRSSTQGLFSLPPIPWPQGCPAQIDPFGQHRKRTGCQPHPRSSLLAKRLPPERALFLPLDQDPVPSQRLPLTSAWSPVKLFRRSQGSTARNTLKLPVKLSMRRGSPPPSQSAPPRPRVPRGKNPSSFRWGRMSAHSSRGSNANGMAFPRRIFLKVRCAGLSR